MMRFHVTPTPIVWAGRLEGLDPVTGKGTVFWTCGHQHPDSNTAHECAEAEVARRFPELAAEQAAEVPS